MGCASNVYAEAALCRPGVCLRLFSRVQWAALAAHQLPEMLRSPLEPLCLQVKSVLPQRRVEEVLACALPCIIMPCHIHVRDLSC